MSKPAPETTCESGDPPIFVSYSTDNTEEAFALVEALESSGFQCWIAPRNIKAGENYAQAIMKALNACERFMLVFSKSSNASVHVQREVERAVNARKEVIPVRIENIEATEGMEFFLATVQWLDAFEKPVPSRFENVIAHCKGTVQEGPPPGKKSAPSKQALATIAALIAIVAAATVWATRSPDTKPDPVSVSTKPDMADSDWIALLPEPTRNELNGIPSDFALSLSANSSSLPPEYPLGSLLSFWLTSEVDAHVVVIIRSSDGSEIVVYPNVENRDTSIYAGQPLQVPGAQMQLTAAEPIGNDVIFAIASTDPKELESFVASLTPAAPGLEFAMFSEELGVRGVVLNRVPTQRTGDQPTRFATAGMKFKVVPTSE